MKMKFKVVMTSRVLSHKDIEAYREKIGVEFFTIPCQTEDEIITAARDADAVITLLQPFSRRVIEKLENCKLIFNAGTGFETIDVPVATEHGICVAYPGEYCTEEVSEHAMALLFACARKITRLDRAVREGKWNSFEKREIRGKILPPIFRIKGQTLGIIGLGRIGRATVPKAKGVGLKVIAFSPNLPADIFKELSVESVSLNTLLRESDFVCVNTTLTAETKYMMDLEHFRMMKPTAYIINTARGSLIDQEALYKALAEGIIAGAALDVVEEEPAGINAYHPLLTLDNVIITAHSAYYSEQSSAIYKQRIYEAIAHIVNGELPEWIVNPEVIENFKSRSLKKDKLRKRLT